jgi:hypothetical protein
VLEQKKCGVPNGSVVVFGSRCRKYTTDQEVAAEIEMWRARREAGGFLSEKLALCSR